MVIDIPKQAEVIVTYGVDAQLGIHMEECAELIQAISKANRDKQPMNLLHEDVYKNLIEEMADVLICMEQLKEIFGITDGSIQEVIYKKAERQKQRMGKYWELKGAELEGRDFKCSDS